MNPRVMEIIAAMEKLVNDLKAAVGGPGMGGPPGAAGAPGAPGAGMGGPGEAMPPPAARRPAGQPGGNMQARRMFGV